MMEQLLEYFGVLTGLLYLFLEIRQHRAMWVVGFLTSLVYVFVFFFSSSFCGVSLSSEEQAHNKKDNAIITNKNFFIPSFIFEIPCIESISFLG